MSSALAIASADCLPMDSLSPRFIPLGLFSPIEIFSAVVRSPPNAAISDSLPKDEGDFGTTCGTSGATSASSIALRI